MFENVLVIPLLLGLLSGLVIYFIFWKIRKSKKALSETPQKPTLESVARELLETSEEKLKPSKDLQKEGSLDKSSKKVSLKTQRKDLKEALQGTKSHLLGRIQGLFQSSSSLSEEDLETLEEILYTSDLGPKTVQRLIEKVHESFEKNQLSNFESLCEALRTEMIQLFESSQSQQRDSEEESEKGTSLSSFYGLIPLKEEASRPQVWMIVGVNGAGKTTTIGKLSHLLAKEGYKVLVAAGDTFRAAAGDQLKVWSERAQVEIFSPENIKDPSAVAYEACEKAQSKGFDVVLVDTAGRLHTQNNLMEELKKMKRVIHKVISGAPHETLLVLDSNSGQNALVQAEKFHQALDVTGVVLTKLDGTAKGGVAVGLAFEHALPIKMIGVGESIEDLRPFNAQEFVDSII